MIVLVGLVIGRVEGFLLQIDCKVECDRLRTLDENVFDRELAENFPKWHLLAH